MQLYNIISTFISALMFAASVNGDTWTGVDSTTTTTTFTTTLTTSIAMNRSGNEKSQIFEMTMLSPIRKEKIFVGETTPTSNAIQNSNPENLSPETRSVSHIIKCCQMKHTSALTSRTVFDADYITTRSGCRSSTRPAEPSSSSTIKKSSSSTGGAGRIGLASSGLGLIAAILV